jgi:putative DNA primase/helicase
MSSDTTKTDTGLFSDPDPCSEPVDPEQLLADLVNMLRRFIVASEHQIIAVAFWIVHTHLTGSFENSPIAIINAPERACGKTLLLNVLERLVYRPLSSANASPSALFRAIEKWGPTILIDEADTFFKDNFDLQGMVNAGYGKDGCVLRTVARGDGYDTVRFRVYGAKAIAGIALQKHLPDSTLSRGIILNLRRKLKHEKVERLRYADAEDFTFLTSKIARFAEDNAEQIENIRPELPERLSDRAQDNWEPLYKIAHCVGEKWVDLVRQASLDLSKDFDSISVSSNELLHDIKEVFDESGNQRISSANLIETLSQDQEKAWATYNRGKPISPRQIANMLGHYGISPKTVRLGPHSTPKGYEMSQFSDAFSRYLQDVDVEETTQQLLPPTGAGVVVDDDGEIY